ENGPAVLQIEATGKPLHFGFEEIVRSPEQEPRRRLDLRPGANEVLDAASWCEPALVKEHDLLARRSLLQPLASVHCRNLGQRRAIRDGHERAAVILG